MGESYTKLSSTLVHSTVWRESAETRCVWITMLALADQHGEVLASIPGLADASRVTLEECELALAKFLAPDTYSRSKVLEGRRITEVPGGWHIVNHAAYRGLLSMDHRKALNAERQRRHRERHAVTRDVTKNNGESRQAVSSKQMHKHQVVVVLGKGSAEGEGTPPARSGARRSHSQPMRIGTILAEQEAAGQRVLDENRQ